MSFEVALLVGWDEQTPKGLPLAVEFAAFALSRLALETALKQCRDAGRGTVCFKNRSLLRDLCPSLLENAQLQNSRVGL